MYSLALQRVLGHEKFLIYMHVKFDIISLDAI